MIRIQAEGELGHIDRAILDEPLQVQATLLDYAGDKELVLKAWIALSKYQNTARKILLLYGSEPEFKSILRTYGDAVIPVIEYFWANDVWSISVMDATGKAIEAARKRWRQVMGNEQEPPNLTVLPKPVELGPVERGWYAVNFIKQEGHDFLAQFVVGADKVARWNQVDRVVKASTAFFTSGIRNLETKRDLGDDIEIADVFWAGLDVAIVAVPAKLLVGGKAIARSGKELNLSTRTRLFAPRLLAEGTAFRKIGVYGVALATIYIVARHPSLLNSIFAEIAGLVGISPWIMQAAGWSVVIAFLIYVFSWLLIPLGKFALFLLRRFERSPKPT